MLSQFRCPRCGMEWGFLDLTKDQARNERRDICMRCRVPANPQPLERLFGWLRGK